ncbi:MAG: hypothetical protein H6745_18930 [Deltaproteobacteria bacterium]|nr:hypothetical protein [Deltaproteobacteria bacterium]
MNRRHAPLALAFCFASLVALSACSSDGGGSADTATTAPDADTTTADDDADTAVAADTIAADTAEPEPPHPLTLEERGYTEVRTIVHLHSAFSHDGCDEMGLDEDGKPNWTCVRRMKAALCAEHIGVAFMTDHPAHMREQAFEDLLYAEPETGDALLRDDDGNAWGIHFHCPAGQGGPDGTVVLVPGFEGTHTMGIGLRRHLSDPAHYGTDMLTETAAADIQAAADDIHGVGGMLTVAHSEQTELDAATIITSPADAMELYNFHANFNTVLGTDIGAALFLLEPFLGQSAPPDADLAALAMLGTYPDAALTKWRTVSASRPITAFAGSDVHENVLLPALCADTDACDSLAESYPNLVDALKVGGNLHLTDGERIDAYARVFRWVANRVWIAPGTDQLAGVEAAFRAGRVNVIFGVLGDAPGVAFLAETPGEDGGDAVVHDMGETLPAAAGATLWVRSPDAPVPGRLASWTDGAPAELTTTLWRTVAGGETTQVLQFTGPATWRSVAVTEVGSYHVEVTVVPKHLAPALDAGSTLDEASFRWVETNAIRLE